MAKTPCPIELEPRTLSGVELTQARELAAEVVQNMEPSEAAAVFFEGIMHPIKEEAHMDKNNCKNEKLIDFTKKKETIPYEKVCQCQCSSSTESPFCIVGAKEPLSAPF
ncbi:unnamed protein product [Lathyrus oleraceus]|uniref:Uncharacterized protein n=1 Tax=Pisum sativum TaxID=3888 RepID=A0A9D5AUY9_PEA|nr:uncharacterized protein LOC127076496 [Pisum sativum]KAI5422858.1 hypothetical protein KIW84_046039 [Pisum sativum]